MMENLNVGEMSKKMTVTVKIEENNEEIECRTIEIYPDRQPDTEGKINQFMKALSKAVKDITAGQKTFHGIPSYIPNLNLSETTNPTYYGLGYKYSGTLKHIVQLHSDIVFITPMEQSALNVGKIHITADPDTYEDYHTVISIFNRATLAIKGDRQNMEFLLVDIANVGQEVPLKLEYPKDKVEFVVEDDKK